MHPQLQGKLSSRGDDAQQVSQDNSMMVVVDGVGGWHRRGVDVSKYSWALTSGIGKAFQNTTRKEIPAMLKEGHKQASAQVGSATICLAHLKGTTLQTANLGDSGQAIIRPDIDNKLTTLFKSVPMQFSHNHPLQLAWDDTEPLSQVEQNKHEVEKGDVIVLATDGFWDNVWDQEMRYTLSECLKRGLTATDMAKDLCVLAVTRGNDRGSVTPWTKDGFVAHGMLPSTATYEETLQASSKMKREKISYVGGKPDDTTVLIGIVCENDMIVSKI